MCWNEKQLSHQSGLTDTLSAIALFKSLTSRSNRQQNNVQRDKGYRGYARFPIGTTFPSFRGTRDTTAALARSSKAVAMYFA
jgi:hypothetical protein